MHIIEFLCNKACPNKIIVPGRRGKDGILTKSAPHEYALSATEIMAPSGKENVIKMMLF
ncbi:hypothetical protein V2T44_07175 [Serratia ficaria]|uniref:hypothetical protein n=1 Tax=Serratia TaxID=613 RepID=UPI0012EED570|nr:MULTISPECIES: hypothetical protein [Serratia]MEE4482745.1 hypothetical protein [Serratia ficaria]